MLKDGKIISDGYQNKVINSENLNKLFGIQVEVTKDNGIWNIYRLSKIQLLKGRQQIPFSATFSMEAFQLNVGDTVQITNERFANKSNLGITVAGKTSKLENIYPNLL